MNTINKKAQLIIFILAIVSIQFSCQEAEQAEEVEEIIEIIEEEIDSTLIFKGEISDNQYRIFRIEEYSDKQKRNVGKQKVKYYFSGDTLELIISSRESSDHPVWRYYLMDGKISYVSETFYEKDDEVDFSVIKDPISITSYFHNDELIYQDRSDQEEPLVLTDSSATQILNDFSACISALNE